MWYKVNAIKCSISDINVHEEWRNNTGRKKFNFENSIIVERTSTCINSVYNSISKLNADSVIHNLNTESQNSWKFYIKFNDSHQVIDLKKSNNYV